jgi:hypothetical protein
MEHELARALLQSLSTIAALVCFRAAPFVGFVVLTRRVHPALRFCAAVVFMALSLLAFRASATSRDALLALPIVYAYLTGLALLLPLAARALRDGWIARLPLAVLLCAAYLFIPGFFASPGALLPALLLGWDSCFKAYSYCIDAEVDIASSIRFGRYRGALFFMLVSPTLVWEDRGLDLGSKSLWKKGLSRCLFALCTWMAEDVLRWMSVLPAVQSWPLPGVLQGVAYYLGHSGLASLQIGFMALLGYRIPERYAYPLLAWHPLEFWRRWNIWLGSWARRYLFVAMATPLRRRLRALPAFAAQGAAAIITFVAIGAFHDAIRGAQQVRHAGMAAVSFDATIAFLAFGVLAAAQAGAMRSLRKAWKRPAPSVWVVRPAGWLAFAPCLGVMYWIAESVLSGRGMPWVTP